VKLSTATKVLANQPNGRLNWEPGKSKVSIQVTQLNFGRHTNVLEIDLDQIGILLGVIQDEKLSLIDLNPEMGTRRNPRGTVRD